MEELKKLQEEEKNLCKLLEENRIAQRAYQARFVCEEYNISLGTKISFINHKNKTITGIIVDFQYGYPDNEVFMPIVNICKKDGTVGKLKTICFYNCLNTIKVIEDNHE